MTTPEITPSAVVIRNAGLISAAVGDELVMMDVDSGTFYALDDIGTFVWERLTGPTLVADLVAELQKCYDVVPEQCEIDVLALLKQMHESYLIQVDA